MYRSRLIARVTQKAFSNLTGNCVKCSNQRVAPPQHFFSRNLTSLSQEQEFLIRIKTDPDTFGDAGVPETHDETDLKEERRFEEQTAPSKKLSTKQYADIIKSFINKRQIKEAIDVVEERMLKQDQVKPDAYIYNLLLGACGKVGYTKKAFSLYNNMKKRGLKATGGTYTALFNACANSPWPEDGLTRAKHLRNIMVEKLYEPNETNYNAMIKAFGRCGDLPTAFSLVDEMMEKKMSIKESVNFLLQACIQDKEAGFRHALLVWRKIVQMNIAPSFHTYNLMLRCIRDCGIGDLEVMNDTLSKILSNNKIQIEGRKQLLLEDKTQKEVDNDSETTKEKTQNVQLLLENKTQKEENDLKIATQTDKVDVCRPNLMAKVPHLGNIISLSEVTKAEDRLLLVGGFREFLNNMAENKCNPDIKTFTQLLDCLPGSTAVETELQKTMKAFNVKPDVDFFNMLIKKRSMRFDYSGGRDVLKEMEKFDYRPDLITFGVLALGCKKKEEALELLQEMKEHSYRLNTEILGAMLHQACHHKNFSYVLEIMEISRKEEVKPNKKFIECLNNFKKTCKKISNDKEDKLYQSTAFQKGFKIFLMRYKTWLDEIEVDDTEDIHPWTQFRQTTETDVRHYKDKADRFKAKHTSLFKVKTSTKRR